MPVGSGVSPAASGPVLEAQALECVRGDRRLFASLEFAVREGELVRIAGSNGAGKTSLLRILSGLSTPESGEVRWRGQAIAGVREAYFADLVYIGHAIALKDDLTALENLRVNMALAGHPVAESSAKAALERLGVARAAYSPAKHLSQGQRRRVTLARLALGPPVSVWILDEPFAALDVAAVRVVEAAIEGHLGAGGIAVITTHQDTAILARASHRVEIGGPPE